MQLTKNFSLEELIHSDTAVKLGLNNNPNSEEEDNLHELCINVLQPSRDYLNESIKVSSGFRGRELNTAIKGSYTSDHTKGKAADLKCSDNSKLFHYIKDFLNFDQLIWEFGDNEQPSWVHVGYRGVENRKQILIAYKENNKTKYKLWDS
jgi:hypothetical protein